jgi:hypothetical protein
MIGIVKALPQPCILIQAELALRKGEAARATQMVMDVGLTDPTPALRAVHVTINDVAREQGINFHKNWRVPDESVLALVFESGGYAEAVENLNWWTTSCGVTSCSVPRACKGEKELGYGRGPACSSDLNEGQNTRVLENPALDSSP